MTLGARAKTSSAERVVKSSSWPPRFRKTEEMVWVVMREERKAGSEMGPSETMMRRDVEVSSCCRAREDFRRVAEEVGRMRVEVVVERRRGMRTRPMLPEAEVMRIFWGGGGEGIFC